MFTAVITLIAATAQAGVPAGTVAVESMNLGSVKAMFR
jgi:hypothetical protein